MPRHHDLTEDEPPVIDPYEVLDLDRGADANQIKTAYRKAALKNHPDKVLDGNKEEATQKFQAIAFAYAILSDPARRKRFDETGSTSEAIVDSEGFSWSEFYSEQFRDAFSEDAINRFAKEYKGSDEEKDDILAAYEKYKGNMNRIYETVMLSNVLEDDERIRKIIDEAIAREDVEAYPKYINESQKSKQARIRAAQREAKEAEEVAKEDWYRDKLHGKKAKKDSMGDLAALIQQRQASRGNALDLLAEKYGAKPNKKRSAKEAEPDISDEQFEALQAKMASKMKKKRG